jgi:hypothetical protein
MSLGAALRRVLLVGPLERKVSLAALGSCALLGASQLGWLPGTRYAWAFNLWAYLPPAAGAALGAAAFALTWASAREAVSGLALDVAQRLRRLPGPAVEAGALLALGALLWLLRERFLLGDSAILFFAVRQGLSFNFPEVGVTWIWQLLWGLRQSVPQLTSLALLSCAAGVLSAWLLLRASRHLAPGRLAPLAVLFALSGGLVRVFAGHIEVYSVLLAALCAYLWAALACLRGRSPQWAAALALGIAIWAHVAAVCLLPSLLLLPRLSRPGAPWRTLVAPALANGALAGVPLLAFLAGAALLGDAQPLERLAERVVEVLGGSPDPDARRWWVRGWGGEPSIGTDVVFLSRAQLKYLANASHLLAPATLPVLAAFALAAPRRFLATPPATFLACAGLPLVAYAFLLRPFWGPFDWDLFSMTALFLSLLASHLLLTSLGAEALRQVLPWLVGFQLLFVTIPFLVVGTVEGRSEGPFRRGAWKYDLQKPATPPPPHVAPWL